ncbi:hypothetical protein CEXT_164621 [Caerostris extrusa]|uniref:Uncharacterized protein n=1 Tax=Caerostris extrusa TaxID=172846 RepID=A0AAV4SJ44_CAEEX|nr:hypothetical protein CEXT_164621 [Caerostris extrusa]
MFNAFSITQSTSLGSCYSASIVYYGHIKKRNNDSNGDGDCGLFTLLEAKEGFSHLQVYHVYPLQGNLLFLHCHFSNQSPLIRMLLRSNTLSTETLQSSSS